MVTASNNMKSQQEEPEESRDMFDMVFGACSPGEYTPLEEELPKQKNSSMLQKDISQSSTSVQKTSTVNDFNEDLSTRRSSQSGVHQEAGFFDSINALFSAYSIVEATQEEEKDTINDGDDDLESFWKLANELSDTFRKYETIRQFKRDTSIIPSSKNEKPVIVILDKEGGGTKGVLVESLDTDEEASRILSIPKERWTRKDKTVMNDLIVRKLENDYQELGCKVDNLSKYAFNDNNSEVPLSKASSWRFKSYGPYDSYRHLRTGFGSVLRSHKGAPISKEETVCPLKEEQRSALSSRREVEVLAYRAY